MRINKYLASCGVSSRRKAEQLITGGHVKLNGSVMRDLTAVINESDRVELNNKLLTPQKFIYIILNKPKGIITSCNDEKGRKTVLDLLKGNLNLGCEKISVETSRTNRLRIFPVGRLDYNTEGLLILTNDGDFAKAVTHPSAQIQKTYIANLDKPITQSDIKKLETGIEIDGELTHPAKAKILSQITVQLTITQGRNRQVRKMFEALGYKVIHLKRTQIGELTLGNLKVGQWRICDKISI